jgi:metallophosphoesterase superfamily enzyme
MNILVLSDLHLSNHDHFSAFGWNEDAFLRKLDLVCTMYGVDRIVLNGDILGIVQISAGTRSSGRTVECSATLRSIRRFTCEGKP